LTALAAIVGYLIGSIPSASLLGRLRGVDLRSEGSGNPGTASALGTSGPLLASLVLIVEAGKGSGAVWLGALHADETGAIGRGSRRGRRERLQRLVPLSGR
jgi:glycerol-3-phosphate acyltransferase PlsY